MSFRHYLDAAFPAERMWPYPWTVRQFYAAWGALAVLAWQLVFWTVLAVMVTTWLKF